MYRNDGAIVNTQPHEELVVDLLSRDIWVRGLLYEPAIPRKEFDILEVLYRNRGVALTRAQIADAGWPERGDRGVTDEEIDQYIRRIRKRIEMNPSNPKLIVTLRGYGYRMSLG